jgi:hypothetical protein
MVGATVGISQPSQRDMPWSFAQSATAGRFWRILPKSIYYIEENANVVGVGTDISLKICCGR